MQAKFYLYARVSTTRQGESGLGLDAQRIAVANYVRGRGELVGEFVEIESGRKGAKDRPQLVAALDRCKREGAALVLGKLDRIARSVRFFLEVDAQHLLAAANHAQLHDRFHAGIFAQLGFDTFIG